MRTPADETTVLDLYPIDGPDPDPYAVIDAERDRTFWYDNPWLGGAMPALRDYARGWGPALCFAAPVAATVVLGLMVWGQTR